MNKRKKVESVLAWAWECKDDSGKWTLYPEEYPKRMWVLRVSREDLVNAAPRWVKPPLFRPVCVRMTRNKDYKP